MTTVSSLETIRTQLGDEIANATVRAYSIVYAVDSANIAALQVEAGTAGDDWTVKACERALAGDEESLFDVKTIITDARLERYGLGETEVLDAILALGELADAMQAEDDNYDDDLTDHIEDNRRDSASKAVRLWGGIWMGAGDGREADSELSRLAECIEDACKRKTF